MVKKIKIKIQNKYIFKTPMNKFLYFFFKIQARLQNQNQ